MESSQIKTPEQEMIETAIQRALMSTDIRVNLNEARTSCFEPIESNELENKSKLFYNKAIPVRKPKKIESSQKTDKEEEVKETIPTADTRQRYINTSSFPQSVHGAIITKKTEDGPPMWGSGVLIGTNIVLTAAHNVYDDEKPTRKRYPYVKFIPGVNGDEAPFGEIDVDQVFAPEDYINHKEEVEDENGISTADYALVILKKPISRETGYFGLHAVLPSLRKLLRTDEMMVVGYPAHTEKEKNEGKFEQWGEKGTIIDFDEEKELIHCKFNVETAGLTGSGIFYKRTELGKDKFYVIGVYLGDNSVCWITMKKFQQLQTWITETSDKKLKELLQNRCDEDYIKMLDFSNKALGTTGVSFLLEWNLKSLEGLNLTACNIDEKGIEALSSNSKWPKLRSLYLTKNTLGEKGCQLLARNNTWQNLKTLSLDRCNIGDLGVKELLQNKIWADLTEVTLGYNDIGDQGALSIGASNNWKNLKKINLESNQIDVEGARAIAMNPTWVNLEELKMSDNKISDEGASAIAMNTTWVNLKKLSLSSNQIGEVGGVSIGNNTSWNKLEELDLSRNQLGNKSAIAIASNPIWNELSTLQLSWNRIDNEGAIAIGRNSSWKQMRKLYLNQNEFGWKGRSVISHNIAWTKIVTVTLDGRWGTTKERKNALKSFPLALLASIYSV